MAINRTQIIDNLSKIKVQGGDNGLIEAFGVYVNQLPTSFWNSFAERLTSKIEPDILSAAENLLINAAQECGYHTGYGIMNSPEWESAVQPMIETTEDALDGAFAVLTAWGWAKIEIIELEPGERMIARAYDYYEADVVKLGKSDKMSAYMVRGICAAFMALAYSGNYAIDGSKVHDFMCRQTKGVECGDDYGEFIVTKNHER